MRILLLISLISIVHCIDLPCRVSKTASDVCVVTKKGDNFNYEKNLVTIVSNKATDVKHIKIIRVNLGLIPVSGLKSFKKLEALTLENCNIQKLDGIKSLRSVQQIFLNKNNISTIPDTKFNSKVVYIEAQYNHLQNVSKNAFKNLENLYWVDLSNNRIKKIHRKLFIHNHVLTSINLSNNRIKNIRNAFKQQDNLRFLKLSYNKITRVPEQAFSALRNLRELDLSNNKINHVDPMAFDSCTGLVLLNLNNNMLKHLNFIVPNKVLSFLNLMDNHLVNLTVNYKEKPIRLVLDASNTVPMASTDDMMTIKFQRGLPVSSLNLANNNLRDINAIALTTNLQKLSLANNTLIGNSSLIRLLTLPDVYRIDMEGTNLTPEQLTMIFQIKSLKFLDISNNVLLSGIKDGDSALIKPLISQNCNITDVHSKTVQKASKKITEIDICGKKVFIN